MSIEESIAELNKNVLNLNNNLLKVLEAEPTTLMEGKNVVAGQTITVGSGVVNTPKTDTTPEPEVPVEPEKPAATKSSPKKKASRKKAKPKSAAKTIAPTPDAEIPAEYSRNEVSKKLHALVDHYTMKGQDKPQVKALALMKETCGLDRLKHVQEDQFSILVEAIDAEMV